MAATGRSGPRMARVREILAGTTGGLAMAVLGVIAFIFAFGNTLTEEAFRYGVLAVFFVLSAIGLSNAVLSESVYRALRALLPISAAVSFSFPLSAIIAFSARALTGAESGAGAMGTALGGGLATVFFGVVGFCLGLMLLSIALVMGRAEPERQAGSKVE